MSTDLRSDSITHTHFLSGLPLKVSTILLFITDSDPFYICTRVLFFIMHSFIAAGRPFSPPVLSHLSGFSPNVAEILTECPENGEKKT